MGTSSEKITLIKAAYSADGIGNSIPNESKKDVLGDDVSASQSEFYAAGHSGRKPEKVFTIRRYEYGDENEVEHNGKRYTVIRTFAKGIEDIELHCERKVANNGEE